MKMQLLIFALISTPLMIGQLGAHSDPLASPCLHGITIDEEAELRSGGSLYRLGQGDYCKT